MLSYRHAFHAGNHADVLKHFVLTQVLDYFNQKDKPYWVIDTHAGAGLYQLDAGFAAQNAEWVNGIAKLQQAQHLPTALQQFLHTFQKACPQAAQNLYPGSPFFARALLREQDKLRLFELHPADYKILLENFAGEGRQVKIEMQNGFEGIKACLPPPTKRAVVLIDPPYELKEDYRHVAKCLQDCLKRFATGTYLVWYPLLQRAEPLQMVEALKKLCPNNWLNVTLSIKAPSKDGFGMYGSGMFIINPPWSFPKMLQETMPVLRDLLALDEVANFTLSHQIS
ncbi:MAG TPA: 23S rRNA (adenine(2030)-N(6))-methyltransferase RlmJ [Methylophilus sp.]|nr:23S rRNA (adenine(2030)-N(6))-methyltransferase RlmJ [Methylophilus sp.]HQQ33419.1 23S rRNA (adenine(2030)-N(6))-methyltransferase RlmJ [Methylophilus sp.]